MTSYNLISGGEPSKLNIYIDSVFLLPNIENYSGRRIVARVSHTGEFSEEVDILIKLLSGKKQLSSYVLNSGYMEDITFDISEYDREQVFRLEISGDDKPFDNHFFFRIPVIVPVKVALISAYDVDNAYLKAVFQNKLFFDLSIMNEENFDFDLLERSDLIVLNGFESIPEASIGDLENTIIIFPSDAIQNNYLSNIGLSTSSVQDTTTYELQIDLNIPYFSDVFEQLPEDYINVYAKVVLSFDGSYSSLLRLRSGQEFLVRKENIFVFASPLDDEYTNLVIHPLFVPLMYKLAFEARKTEGNLYYYPGSILVNNFPNVEKPLVLKGQHSAYFLGSTSSNGDNFFEIPHGPDAGDYVLCRDIDTLSYTPVNVLKSESESVQMSAKELSTLFDGVPHVRVFPLSNDLAPESVMRQQEIQTWKYLLMVILLLVITEALLHLYLRV